MVKIYPKLLEKPILQISDISHKIHRYSTERFARISFLRPEKNVAKKKYKRCSKLRIANSSGSFQKDWKQKSENEEYDFPDDRNNVSPSPRFS